MYWRAKNKHLVCGRTSGSWLAINFDLLKKICYNKAMEQFRKNPFVDVYIKKFPFEVENREIFPASRQSEIELCKSEKVRKEKFYSWKLLELALKKSLGVDLKSVDFEKQGTKWACSECHFSISHCQNLVAVAVGNNAVGVDVEKIDIERFKILSKDKILSNEEQKSTTHLDENQLALFLNKMWTKKEAIFKRGKERIFLPNKIEINSNSVKINKIKCGENEYYLSISSGNLNNINLIIDKNIEIIN